MAMDANLVNQITLQGNDQLSQPAAQGQQAIEQLDQAAQKLGATFAELNHLTEAQATALQQALASGQPLTAQLLQDAGAEQQVGAATQQATGALQQQTAAQQQGAAAATAHGKANADAGQAAHNATSEHQSFWKTLVEVEGASKLLTGTLGQMGISLHDLGPIMQVIEGAMLEGAVAGQVLGAALLGATSIVVEFGVKAAEAGMHWEDMTTQIANAAAVGEEEAKALGDSMMTLAAETGQSKDAIAGAFTDIAGRIEFLAGSENTLAASQQIMAAATTGAQAAHVSEKDAAEGLIKTLNAFNLTAADANDAQAILFNASRMTGMGYTELAQIQDRLVARMGDAAPKLGEMATMFTIVANATGAGARAMQPFALAVTNLYDESSKAAQGAAALGVKTTDASQQMRPMQDVVLDLARALEALPAGQQRVNAANEIFGKQGESTLKILQAMTDHYDELHPKITDTSTALEAQARVQQDLETQWAKLNEQAGIMLVNIGDPMVQGLHGLANAFDILGASISGDTAELAKFNKDGVAYIQGVLDKLKLLPGAGIIGGAQQLGTDVTSALTANNAAIAAQDARRFGTYEDPRAEQAANRAANWQGQQYEASVAGLAAGTGEAAGEGVAASEWLIPAKAQQAAEAAEIYTKAGADILKVLDDTTQAVPLKGAELDKQITAVFTALNKAGNANAQGLADQLREQLNLVLTGPDPEAARAQVESILKQAQGAVDFPKVQAEAERANREAETAANKAAAEVKRQQAEAARAAAEAQRAREDAARTQAAQDKAAAADVAQQAKDAAQLQAQTAVEAAQASQAAGEMGGPQEKALEAQIRANEKAATTIATLQQQAASQIADAHVRAAGAGAGAAEQAAADIERIETDLATKITATNQTAADATDKAWQKAADTMAAIAQQSEAALKKADDAANTAIDDTVAKIDQEYAKGGQAIINFNEKLADTTGLDQARTAVEALAKAQGVASGGEDRAEGRGESMQDVAANRIQSLADLQANQQERVTDLQVNHQAKLRQIAKDAHGNQYAAEVKAENERYQTETQHLTEQANREDQKWNERQQREDTARAQQWQREDLHAAEADARAQAAVAYKQSLEEAYGISKEDLAEIQHQQELTRIRTETEARVDGLNVALAQKLANDAAAAVADQQRLGQAQGLTQAQIEAGPAYQQAQAEAAAAGADLEAIQATSAGHTAAARAAYDQSPVHAAMHGLTPEQQQAAQARATAASTAKHDEVLGADLASSTAARNQELAAGATIPGYGATAVPTAVTSGTTGGAGGMWLTQGQPPPPGWVQVTAGYYRPPTLEERQAATGATALAPTGGYAPSTPGATAPTGAAGGVAPGQPFRIILQLPDGKVLYDQVHQYEQVAGDQNNGHAMGGP